MRNAIKCRTFSTFSDPEYPFDDPSDIRAIQETLKIADKEPYTRGRNTDLTPLKEHIILKAIKLGLTIDRAASLAGVGASTIYQWKRYGNEDAAERRPNWRKYKTFTENLKLASIHGELEKLRLVNEAAEGGVPIREVKTKVRVNPKTGKETVLCKETKMKSTSPSWQAAMTLLERRYPERWGKVARLDEEDAADIAHKIKSEVNRLLDSVPAKKKSNV